MERADMSERLPDAEFRVLTAAIRKEGDKWGTLADQMSAVNATVQGLKLDASAFFPITGANFIAEGKYKELHELMKTLTADATTEFREMKAALYKAADKYRETENKVVVDLKQIYG
jgi:hypothetical protein